MQHREGSGLGGQQHAEVSILEVLVDTVLRLNVAWQPRPAEQTRRHALADYWAGGQPGDSNRSDTLLPKASNAGLT